MEEDHGRHPGRRLPLGRARGSAARWAAVRRRPALTVNGQSLTQSFEILKDSRLDGIVSDGDIGAEFELVWQVRNRASDANQGVINIRDCAAQIDDRIASTGDAEVVQRGTALATALSAVENELYQTKLRSNLDPLGNPIKLNNKIATLRGVIESVDSRPTDQTYEVFDMLVAQLRVQLDKLAQIVNTDVPAFNQLLGARGLAAISCNAVDQGTASSG